MAHRKQLEPTRRLDGEVRFCGNDDDPSAMESLDIGHGRVRRIADMADLGANAGYMFSRG
jgi:hypothetical protein